MGLLDNIDLGSQAPQSKFTSFIHSILPTVLHNRLRPKAQKSRPLARTAYLDGVRGLAALGVVMLHMVLGFFPESSYAYNGTENRDHFLQMPIVRLLYSGQPTIFFFISGYVLSLSTIKKCRNQSWVPLQLDLSSKVFRRLFRLYIPSIVSTFIPMVMISFNLFPGVVEFEGVPHNTSNMAEQEDSFFMQFWLWCKMLPPFLWPFSFDDYSQNMPYAYQLWTIPVEFRCSMVLFLVHIALARCRSSTRLWLNCIISLYFLTFEKWDVFLFLAGSFLAEVDIIKEELTQVSLPKSENGGPRPPSPSQSPNPLTPGPRVSIACLVFSLWILSVPAADIWNAWTFEILETLSPRTYTAFFRFWDAIGTVLLICSITWLPSVQRFFIRPFFLYLGNISFSLYLTHTIVLKFVLYPLMPWLFLTFGHETDFQYFLSFGIGAVITFLFSFWVADVFQRHVEEPSGHFSRWIDAWCSAV